MLFESIQVSPFETAMSTIQAFGGLAGVAALVAAAWTWRHGVKGDERAAREVEAVERRDTISDRDALIDQLQEDVASLRAEVAECKAAVAARDAAIAARDAVIRQQAEYIAACRDHIYRGRPAPPPPAPA